MFESLFHWWKQLFYSSSLVYAPKELENFVAHKKRFFHSCSSNFEHLRDYVLLIVCLFCSKKVLCFTSIFYDLLRTILSFIKRSRDIFVSLIREECRISISVERFLPDQLTLLAEQLRSNRNESGVCTGTCYLPPA